MICTDIYMTMDYIELSRVDSPVSMKDGNCARDYLPTYLTLWPGPVSRDWARALHWRKEKAKEARYVCTYRVSKKDKSRESTVCRVCALCF